MACKAEVHALALAVTCFPKETPRRWSLVSKLLGKPDSLGSTTLEVGLPSAPGTYKLLYSMDKCCNISRLLYIIIIYRVLPYSDIYSILTYVME